MRGCPCGRQRRCRKRIDEYENRRQVVKGGILGFAVIIPGVSGSSMASDAARPRANPRGFSPLTQQKRRSAKPLCRFWRKVRDYLRRHENKMETAGRRLDGFGRCAPSREPAGVLTLTQQKRRSAKPLCRFWRKVRDSNPRMLAHQRFSSFIPRLLHFVCYCCLTARIVGKSAFWPLFYSIIRAFCYVLALFRVRYRFLFSAYF